MQIKIGFGFLILVVIVLGFLLWRSNRKLKAVTAMAEKVFEKYPLERPMGEA